jgi:hypothetical protein
MAQCAIETVIVTVESIAQAAADFVRDHPGLVVGTIVVIAGVAMIATMGPAGAVVLVAI